VIFCRIVPAPWSRHSHTHKREALRSQLWGVVGGVVGLPPFHRGGDWPARDHREAVGIWCHTCVTHSLTPARPPTERQPAGRPSARETTTTNPLKSNPSPRPPPHTYPSTPLPRELLELLCPPPTPARDELTKAAYGAHTGPCPAGSASSLLRPLPRLQLSAFFTNGVRGLQPARGPPSSQRVVVGLVWGVRGLVGGAGRASSCTICASTSAARGPCGPSLRPFPSFLSARQPPTLRLHPYVATHRSPFPPPPRRPTPTTNQDMPAVVLTLRPRWPSGPLS